MAVAVAKLSTDHSTSIGINARGSGKAVLALEPRVTANRIARILRNWRFLIYFSFVNGTPLK
jgi:hypothetical protein